MDQSANFFETAMNSERGQECIRLWGKGVPAAKAIETAFGAGAVEYMAKQIWLSARAA